MHLNLDLLSSLYDVTNTILVFENNGPNLHGLGVTCDNLLDTIITSDFYYYGNFGNHLIQIIIVS
jgi:hypothetical protein